MCFCNPRCESRDVRVSDGTRTSDLCSAMCTAENHLRDAMCFIAICALAAEIHCDVGNDANIAASAMPVSRKTQKFGEGGIGKGVFVGKDLSPTE